MNIREVLNKIQPNLGLVNQLLNQDKLDFKEQNTKLNVMDLLDTDSRGLIHPVPLERHLDNPWTQRNRKKYFIPTTKGSKRLQTKRQGCRHSRYIHTM